MPSSLGHLSRLTAFIALVLLAGCRSTTQRAWNPAATPETSALIVERGAETVSTPSSIEALPVNATSGFESGEPLPMAYGPQPLAIPREYTPLSAQETATPPETLQYYDNIYRKWGVSAGAAALATFHTKLQVSSPVLVGAILDLEDLLGVDSKSVVARLDGFYSFNKRHRIDMAYYDIRRSGTRTIGEDIEVGDVVIPAGAVDTGFNTKIFKLAYRYNFVTDYRTVIGVSGGFHTMGIETSVKASAGTVDQQASLKALAPLPLIGLHGAYALSPKWRLTANVETLRVAIENFSGFVVDTRLSLEHDTFEHLGWGIGFNTFNLSAQVDGDTKGFKANVDYGYSGLMLYVRTYF